jgi:nucleoside phosphorylase
MTRLALFAALRWECAPILRSMRQVRRSHVDAFTVWTSTMGQHEMWLVKTGIGQARAAAAAAAVERAGAFGYFLSTGCAGALAPDLVPGDVTVATAVIGSPSGTRFDTHAELSRQVCAAADRAALRAMLGPLLSSTALLATAAAKQEAAATGAVAVEMEGAAIGACAQRAAIPFAAVRVILDTASTELHGSGTFVDPQTGALRPWSLLRYVASRPSALTHLLALQRMTAAAQRSLDRFFATFFAQP